MAITFEDINALIEQVLPIINKELPNADYTHDLLLFEQNAMDIARQFGIKWEKESVGAGGEPWFWRIENTTNGYWRAQIMWDHHDGEIPHIMVAHESYTYAVYQCLVDMYTKPADTPFPELPEPDYREAESYIF